MRAQSLALGCHRFQCGYVARRKHQDQLAAVELRQLAGDFCANTVRRAGNYYNFHSTPRNAGMGSPHKRAS
jgi:hypothetical protein